MPDRTCGTCGAIFSGPGSRCPEHARRTVPSPTKRAQGPEYFKERSRVFSAAGVYAGNATCGWCGDPVKPRKRGEAMTPKTAVADHVVPVSRGGGHAGNLVVACHDCNSRRRNNLGPPARR